MGGRLRQNEQGALTGKAWSRLLLKSTHGFLEKLGFERDKLRRSHSWLETFKSSPSSFKTRTILAKSIGFEKYLIKRAS